MADRGSIGSGHTSAARNILWTADVPYIRGSGHNNMIRNGLLRLESIIVKSPGGHSTMIHNMNTVVVSAAIGAGHQAVIRDILPTSDFPIVKSNTHITTLRNITSVILSSAIGVGHTNAGRDILPTSDFPIVSGKRRNTNLASKNIAVWSTRVNPNMGATAVAPQQVYLTDNPGIISGQLKTSVILDANHVVRLYYRPNGYMIDQVRTDSNGYFTFSKNVDKNEVGNYYVIAFDLNNTYNAVVFDLLTPS